jgi:hypothetical protein
MAPDVATVVLSAIAVLVSAWAAREARQTAGDQNEMQRRLLALEQARERDRQSVATRAELRAAIHRIGDSRYVLVIANEGACAARAVSVRVDGQPVGEHQTFVVDSDSLVTKLGPGAEARYQMAVAMGSPLVYDVQLLWEDDSRLPREWSSQLSL